MALSLLWFTAVILATAHGLRFGSGAGSAELSRKEINGVQYPLTGSWNDLGLNPWQNRQEEISEEIDGSGLRQIPEIFPSARLGRRFLQFREDYVDPGPNTDPRNSASTAPPPPWRIAEYNNYQRIICWITLLAVMGMMPFKYLRRLNINFDFSFGVIGNIGGNALFLIIFWLAWAGKLVVLPIFLYRRQKI